MVRPKLVAQSALAQLALPARYGRPGAAGVSIAQRPASALAIVIARNGTQARLAARVREAFGCELPFKPRRTAGPSVAFAWAGPHRWLANAPTIDPAIFASRLRHELIDLASISDQSDGLVLVGMRGPKARDTLAKGVPIDLHPRHFRPGHVAITTAAHIGVTLWQLDEAPTYELAVMRSYAASFWEWLVDAAAEFGLAIGEAWSARSH
jgi:methylglutamate dehydrogenase subunit D